MMAVKGGRRAVRGFAGMMLVMVLALLGAARADGPVCVCVSGVACLVDEDGQTLLEGFEDAFPVRQGALYAAGSKGDYRLYDAQGLPVGDVEFAMAQDAGDCLIYRQGGLYGAMDETGSVILPAEWTQLIYAGAGGFLALNSDPLDETPDEILRVDVFGWVTPTGVYTDSGLAPMESGRARVAVNGRAGAVDAVGNPAVPMKWLGLAPSFENGLAVATAESGTGLIDVNGDAVIPAVYDWVERGDGIIAALDASGVDVFSADGKTIIYSVDGENLEALVAGSRLLVRDGENARLYDETGAVIGEYAPGFGCAAGLNGQLIAWEGEWGETRAWLMNPDGSASSGRYQHILPLIGGRYAFAKMRGATYYSAELGRIQTSWDYDSLRLGLLDESGAELLNADYRDIRALGEDRLLLISDDEVKLADLNGRAIRTWVTAETAKATAE